MSIICVFAFVMYLFDKLYDRPLAPSGPPLVVYA